MSIKKRNFNPDLYDSDREGKLKNIKRKNAIDKHRKIIYNIASSKKADDEIDDFDYDYLTFGNGKFKQR